MLAHCAAMATLPAADFARARQFYEVTLGLSGDETPGGMMYHCGGTTFLLYASGYAGTAQNTAMSWLTDDIETLVAWLKSRGVVFEAYDFPGLKTVNGIADIPGERAAWFKDSEGNILAVGQLT